MGRDDIVQSSCLHVLRRLLLPGVWRRQGHRAPLCLARLWPTECNRRLKYDWQSKHVYGTTAGHRSAHSIDSIVRRVINSCHLSALYWWLHQWPPECTDMMANPQRLDISYMIQPTRISMTTIVSLITRLTFMYDDVTVKRTMSSFPVPADAGSVEHLIILINAFHNEIWHSCYCVTV